MSSPGPTQNQSSDKRSINQRQKLNRLPTTQIPARLRYGDDANEDVTAPGRAGPQAQQYMNQSIFSMIAAAGSRTDFNKRFDESSDSEGDGTPYEGVGIDRDARLGADVEDLKRTQTMSGRTKAPRKATEKHTTRSPTRSLSQAIPEHPFTTSRTATPAPKQRIDQSPESDGSSDSIKSNPRDAPIMSRILSAEAKFEAAEGTETPKTRRSHDLSRNRADSSPATLLATRIKEVFQLETAETVIGEYACWLLQSVLLQGYLYITNQHLCFYAYLAKKANVVTKTGYLSKRGRNNSKYKRSWFTLKGDVITYYAAPSEVYFPQGHIDLRYAISASLSAEQGKQKDCKDFLVETDSRTYYFKADSPSSAQEWVKTLQKTIFRSHNDGDSVKLVLPVKNIVDIEHSPVVEFAETVKLRVVESGDSYAMDEYFFSFFSNSEDVMNVFAKLMADSSKQRHLANDPSQTSDQDMAAPSSRDPSPGGNKSSKIPPHNLKDSSRSSPIRENVRATVMPLRLTKASKSPPKRTAQSSRSGRRPDRDNLDDTTKKHGESSSDGVRRRGSTPRHGAGEQDKGTTRPSIGRHRESVDSYDRSSFDDQTDSSVGPPSPSVDARMSASQILVRSDVFHAPAVKRMDTLQSVSTSEQDKISDTDTAPPSASRTDNRSSPVEDMVRQALEGRQRIDTAQSDTSEQKMIRNTSSPALQDLVKAGSYPLAKAGALAGYLKNRSTKMSKALATESMSYLEKVTGMWQGGHQHYGQNEGIVPDDKDVDPEDEEANVGHGDRFRAHFALPSTEKLQATYFGYIVRVLPLYGKIYVSNRKFCFRSLLPGTRTKLVLPIKDIENVDKEKGFRFGYHGLVLVIRGHEELFFEFNTSDIRDDCTVTLLHSLESVRHMAESGILGEDDEDNEATAIAEHRMLQEARKSSVDIAPPETNQTIYHQTETSSLFDSPRALVLNSKPSESLRITCLTIGSRGDVQPYIALCKGLLAEGHKPRICTHAEFGPWVTSYGIEFEPVGGDPAELMRICVEHGMFTYSFLREATAHFRVWIEDLLSSSWKACQNSDILIESPSAMAGIHIAEAMGIPYFRAFTMPWTRTRAYPHAFAVPEHKIGGAYNYFSYIMFDNVFWKGIAGQVNRWRKRELGLPSTNLDKMQPNKVPFLYNFSAHVVAPPLDYSDWVRVTGYWFLDEGASQTYTPPADLAAFIASARADGKKLVYIGFGSIVVSDPAALTKTVIASVLKADVRCILSKGWSDRLGDPSSTKTELPLPPEILQIKSAPHDWLFPRVDAAVHHGGAGTTGASLRAGIPTVIKPFFGDQFFFGGRVEDLGVGILLRKVNVSVFARALWESCHSERMKVKARELGESIRKENGVQNAIHAIYRDLEYARSLIKARQSNLNTLTSGGTHTLTSAEAAAVASLLDYETEADLEGEESWTFIGDENEIDTELRRRMSGANTPTVGSSTATRESRSSLNQFRSGGGGGGNR